MDVLCLKLHLKRRAWSPEMMENTKSSKKFHSKADRSKRIETLRRTMSLQMPVTEDTPPDMLSGAMDLNVILPNGSVIKMSVERSTPMMDLLVQITTAHKLSPGSHAIHAIGDRGVLPYKPSTPIGALDTWTVNIVPKSLSKNGRYQNQTTIKCIPKPFEQTFRLQVHLPRNQLYVARISPKTQLNAIRKQVCFEKNLDPAKYTLRNPDKLNEPLDLKKTLVEYKLQQLTLVLNTNRTLIGGLSSDDIMSRPPKKFSCDDSLSSGSLGGRSLSPTRSDESSGTPRRSLMVKVLPSRPVRKRRLAPKPPLQQQNAAEQTIISHSRNSSDSSGYHESSVLSDAVDFSNGVTKPGKFSPSKPSGSSMSRSMTNLQTCGQTQNRFSEIPFRSDNIGQSKHSISTTSLISIQSRKKKAAPPPPLITKPKLAPPQEESESEPEIQRKSQTLPVLTKLYISDSQEKSKTVSRIEMNNNVVESNLSPATSSLSSLSRSDVDRGSTADEDELRMDDEEIDRIFGDATNGYDTPSIITIKENNADVSDIDWEYKLPDPPSAFRDSDHSPTVTMFDTVTIGNLKDIVVIQDEPIVIPVETKENIVTIEESVKKIIGNEYHCFPQDSGVGSDDSSLPSSCEEKLLVDEKSVKTVEPKESKLNNFKIVTYNEDCTRPTEIFCDDSVKTWKTTQMARESNPAYKSQISNSVNRHKSFSMDRINSPVTVKRSTSHISLLSGNIKPSNRLAKHYIGRTYSTERLNYGDSSLVKRSFSVDNITEDVLESNQHDYENKINPKKIEPSLEQSSPLHSLQILKSILPQIEDHEFTENDKNTILSSNEVADVPNTSLAEIKLEESDERRVDENSMETTRKVERKLEAFAESCPRETEFLAGPEVHWTTTSRDVGPSSKLDAERHAQSTHHQEFCKSSVPNRPQLDRRETGSRAVTSKRYSYAGPPAVSVSTWNERPRRQVSIKTDRDYVIGVKLRSQRNFDSGGSAVGEKQEANSKAPETEPAVSRVPVVKSVELKKPYAEQLQATGPALALSDVIKAQAKLSSGYGHNRHPNLHPSPYAFGELAAARLRRPRQIVPDVRLDPRESLLESIRSFGGRDNLRKIRA